MWHLAKSEWAVFQMFKCSNVQMVKCSNFQRFKCSKVQMFQWSNVQMFKSSIGLSGFPEAWAIQLLTKDWGNWKRYITPLSIAHTLNLIDQNLQQKSAVQSLTEFSPVLHWKQQTLPRKYIIPKWYHIDDTSLVPYNIFSTQKLVNRIKTDFSTKQHKSHHSTKNHTFLLYAEVWFFACSIKMYCEQRLNY